MLTTDNPAPVLITSYGATGRGAWTAICSCGWQRAILCCSSFGAVWVAVALSSHRARHRRRLERYEQRLRYELEATYRRRAERQFDKVVRGSCSHLHSSQS